MPHLLPDFTGNPSDTSFSSSTLTEDRTFYNLKKVPKFALETLKCNISDQSAASLANALLEDFEIVKKSDQSNVFDRQKMRRQRIKYASEAKDELQGTKLKCIGFDGREDKDCMVKTIFKDNELNIELEKITNTNMYHLTFTSESGPHRNQYLEHMDCPDKKGKIHVKIWFFPRVQFLI